MGAVTRPRPLPRRRGLRALLPWTLRGRLIAGLVTLLALGCAAVGITTYLATKNSLMRELTTQVQTAAGVRYGCLENPDGDNSGAQDMHPWAGGKASGVRTQAAGTADADSPDPSQKCLGLGPGTLEVTISDGQMTPAIVDGPHVTLTPADQATLRQLHVTRMPPPDQAAPQPPTYVKTLNLGGGASGAYMLTAITDLDGDSVVITGLPLGSVYDMLHDLAVAELIVFGTVLLLAGVLGTFWVRLSLRSLRRVAATASQVAELPLESGAVELPAGVPDTDPRTETGQLGAAFNRMLGHVQSALARRNASETRLRRFAADASHELRTPLAAIRGYAELALRRPGDSPEEVTHALRRVLSESTRMSVLVDDLLLLARLDAGRPLGREPVDMSRVTIDATSDARVARPGHRWVLDLPDDPVLVRGDEDRLHQVLVNLLSNAGKHTPERTMVTVRLRAVTTPAKTVISGTDDAGSAQHDAAPSDVAAPVSVPATARGGSDAAPASPVTAGAAEPATPGIVRRGTLPAFPRLELTVTDDGPGVPPDLLPELFERFTRADTARTHVGDQSSTGLGLAIVDAVVAAHRGAVQVTSRPGQTCFAIALPLLAEQAEGSPRRTRSRKAARSASQGS